MLVPTLIGALLALAIAVPLAWKWELGVRRVAIAVTVFALLSALAVAAMATVVDLPAALRALLILSLIHI